MLTIIRSQRAEEIPLPPNSITGGTFSHRYIWIILTPAGTIMRIFANARPFSQHERVAGQIPDACQFLILLVGTTPKSSLPLFMRSSACAKGLSCHIWRWAERLPSVRSNHACYSTRDPSTCACFPGVSAFCSFSLAQVAGHTGPLGQTSG